MIRKLHAVGAILAIALLAGSGWADQIILKNGTEYSGKFIRGDSGVVEFRVLGRIEIFETKDVAQIIFKEPELVTAPAGRTVRSTEIEPPTAPRPPATGAAPAGRTATATTPAAAAASASRSGPVTIPSGTPIAIRTITPIDTEQNRVGDTFDATLEDPITLQDRVIIQRGTPIKGVIAYAKDSGRLAGQAELILELLEMTVDGRRYALRTTDYVEVGSSRGKRTAATVGGTAALGAIIGAIAGGGKGAAVGAATGAGVGTGIQILTKGQTLKVPAETILEFKLQNDLLVDAP